MSRPDTLPSWCDDDSSAKVVEPSGVKKLAGFLYKERPAMQYFNWLIRNLVKWVTYFDDVLEQRVYAFAIKVGATFSFTGITSPNITRMSDTDIAYIESTGNQLRSYRWNGLVWTLLGSGLTISGASSVSAVAALNSTDVVLWNAGLVQLRLYRFNGSTWSQIGNSFTITGAVTGQLAALNSTDVAFTDGSNNKLETYRWDGTDFTKIGNSFTMPAYTQQASLAVLNETDIVFTSNTTYDIEAFRFDGTDWSALGNKLELGIAAGACVAAINGTDVVLLSGDDKELIIYRFDGTDWSELRRIFDIAVGVSVIKSIMLNATDFVYIDSSVEDLEVYSIVSYIGGRPHYPV